MKKCCKCKVSKLEIEFNKNKWRPDGLQHYCKVCQRVKVNEKKYRQTRLEKLREKLNNPNYRKKWNERNKLLRNSNPKRKLRQIWKDMIIRCENPKSKFYHRYGGRGIIVCERWKTFGNFYDDMFQTYQKGLSIDRINNDGNYEPTNCRWISRSENSRNRITKRILLTNNQIKDIINSKKSQYILSKEYKVSPATIWRIRNRKVSYV